MRKYEFCSCWRVLTVGEAISDINDEMKEFIEAKTDEDREDEKSDVIWGLGRLLGAKNGIHYVGMDGDELHYQKITERMNKYSCIRSYKKRCTKEKGDANE